MTCRRSSDQRPATRKPTACQAGERARAELGEVLPNKRVVLTPLVGLRFAAFGRYASSDERYPPLASLAPAQHTLETLSAWGADDGTIAAIDMLAGTLRTIEGTKVASASVRRAEGRWEGAVDLSTCPQELVELFMRFDQLVNEQCFSLLDEVQNELARTGFLFDSHRGLSVIDELQVFPGDGTISFRIGINDGHRRFWTKDNGLFGRAIFEGVPPESRSPWAADVLRVFLDTERAPDVVRELVGLAERDVSEWSDARRLFARIRGGGSQSAQAPASSESTLLPLAETVAKVIYNASGAPAPYDSHAGWRLGPRSAETARLRSSPRLADRCWVALTQFESRQPRDEQTTKRPY